MLVKCTYCGEELRRYPYQLNDSGIYYCNSKCQAGAYKNNRAAVKCEYCDADLLVPKNQANKYEENLVGKANPNWQGGSTNSLQYKIRNSWEGQKWRKSIIERDSYQCQHCGEVEHLDVHHIKEFAQIMKDNNITTIEEGIACEELWDTDNGITLCVHCHAEEHPNKKHLILRRVS